MVQGHFKLGLGSLQGRFVIVPRSGSGFHNLTVGSLQGRFGIAIRS